MYPYVTIPFFGSSTMLSTSLFLDLCCVPLALLVVYGVFRSKISIWRQASLVFFVALSAWTGARLFHVVWERPEYFRAHPSEIFTNFQGMTFYGALIAGVLAVLLLNQFFVPRALRSRMLDVSAIIGALFYGILRIGCFADGCCWGRLCRYPWAVRFFNPNSEMPYLGIPVHPVQLYDSFACFLIAGILTYLYNKKTALRGHLMGVFFCLYAVARGLTENFRGDSYRGVNLFLGMSTSQLISVGLFFVGVVILLSKKFSTSGRLPSSEVLNGVGA